MEQYTSEQVVSFGNYLLSNERKKSISFKHNRSFVHHNDFCNWEEQRKQEDGDIIVGRQVSNK